MSMCLTCSQADNSCVIWSPGYLTDWCVAYRPRTQEDKAEWELRLAQQAMRAEHDAPQYWAALCRLSEQDTP